MKVLITCGMFPPNRTGTAFYSLNLANELKSKGHDIEIVTLGQPSRDQDLRLPVHYLAAFQLPLAGFFKHFRLCSFNPMNWLRMYRILRKQRPDVLLLVNHYLDIAFPALILARMSGIPTVCSVGTQLQSLNPRRDKILNLLDWLICGQLVFPLCNTVIAWDTQILKYLQDVQGNRVTRKTKVVNYGVNGDPVALLGHQKSYAASNLIVGVGAVSEQRSFVQLVQAFALLAKEYPDLRLKIVGHVYYDEAIQLAHDLGLSERVEFLGERPHDEVLEILSSADVYYSSLTARYTGMGTATIEAMLLAVPCVVNTPLNLLGTSTMQDNFHIVRLPNLDPMYIAERIKALLSDEGLRRRIGQNGREFVKDNMNWQKVSEDILRILTKAAQKE